MTRRFTLAAVTVLALAALLTTCSTGDPPSPSMSSPSTGAGGADESAAVTCADGSITGQGSSAQANAMITWIREYQTRCPDAAVAYDSIGSGSGIETFIAGEGAFAGTDSLLSADDQPAADDRCGTGPAIHLPMVVGPIALAYNVAGVGELELSSSTIAQIFAGTVSSWDDPAIAADNPDVALPPTPIRPVHRSDGSGTTDNFTAFLAATAPDEWTFGNDRSWPAPGGRAEPGNEGVSAAITSSEGAIGYVEWSFAESFDLDTAKVRNGAGEVVELSTEAAGRGITGAEITGTGGGDLRLNLDYATTEPGAYPIVLVTYEVVCQSGTPAASLDLLKGFLDYTSSTTGQDALARLGYAPLPEEVRTQVATAVAGIN